MKRALLIILLLSSWQWVLAASQLTAIRVSHQSQRTRIVFSFNQTTRYKVFTLANPERIVVDLPGTQLQKKAIEVDLRKTLIQGIRANDNKQRDLRLVLDLKQRVTEKAFWLKATGKYDHRLVLDLTSTQVIPVRTHSTPSVQQNPQVVIDADKPRKLRNLIVMIDPGHGGKDPGASGPRGTHEKKVVLGIGSYLRNKLSQYPGIKVRMTRSGDHYIPLRGRLNLARKYKADIFVSVHADSFKNSRARGASVYALSQRGATSESARWLAQKENESEMLGGAELSNKSYLLRSVLIDMSQTATINNGLSMGSKVLANVKKVARLHSRKVEQAAFVVLKSPDIPSILVENGFISNPYEEASLRTASYQRKLASAITQGIISYFKQKMPRGTIFSAYYGARNYTVKRGDSLSAIAVKFSTSTAELKRLNKLRNTKLHVGQTLRLPNK